MTSGSQRSRDGGRLSTRRLPTLGRWRWLRLVLFVGLGLGALGVAAGAAVFLLYASDPDLPRIARA